ncbi:hypothetical protein HK097_001975 [Rhizophlyctis rosea]|uniref:Uncharacterized protein n=1 Tax=Rhizophlyctis rosea TaxID=64517 RepID=A0AAD5WYN2_9FUNG|nr:hypothetical protein HK097_001975 [Rhizophlyctis rosea]
MAPPVITRSGRTSNPPTRSYSPETAKSRVSKQKPRRKAHSSANTATSPLHKHFRRIGSLLSGLESQFDETLLAFRRPKVVLGGASGDGLGSSSGSASSTGRKRKAVESGMIGQERPKKALVLDTGAVSSDFPAAESTASASQQQQQQQQASGDNRTESSSLTRKILPLRRSGKTKISIRVNFSDPLATTTAATPSPPSSTTQSHLPSALPPTPTATATCPSTTVQDMISHFQAMIDGAGSAAKQAVSPKGKEKEVIAEKEDAEALIVGSAHADEDIAFWSTFDDAGVAAGTSSDQPLVVSDSTSITPTPVSDGPIDPLPPTPQYEDPLSSADYDEAFDDAIFDALDDLLEPPHTQSAFDFVAEGDKPLVLEPNFERSHIHARRFKRVPPYTHNRLRIVERAKSDLTYYIKCHFCDEQFAFQVRKGEWLPDRPVRCWSAACRQQHQPNEELRSRRLRFDYESLETYPTFSGRPAGGAAVPKGILKNKESRYVDWGVYHREKKVPHWKEPKPDGPQIMVFHYLFESDDYNRVDEYAKYEEGGELFSEYQKWYAKIAEKEKEKEKEKEVVGAAAGDGEEWEDCTLVGPKDVAVEDEYVRYGDEDEGKEGHAVAGGSDGDGNEFVVHQQYAFSPCAEVLDTTTATSSFPTFDSQEQSLPSTTFLSGKPLETSSFASPALNLPAFFTGDANAGQGLPVAPRTSIPNLLPSGALSGKRKRTNDDSEDGSATKTARMGDNFGGDVSINDADFSF